MKSAAQWPTSFCQQIFVRRCQHMTCACASSTKRPSARCWRLSGARRGIAVIWATAASAGRRNMSCTGSMVAEAGAACGAQRNVRMLVVRADRSRNVAGAQSFFASNHARLRRASAAATLYFCRHERERLAIPTRSQPQMRGLPYIAEKFLVEFSKHVPAIASRPLDCQPPSTDTKLG